MKCGFVVSMVCGVLLGLGGVAQRPVLAADLTELTSLFRKGEYAACVEASTKAIEEAELNENFRLLKIRAELELGRYADALVSLDAALAKLPNSALLRWVGRDVCRFNRQAERGETLVQEMVKLTNDAPWRYSDIANRVAQGRLLLGQGFDAKKVLDIYNDIKRRQPTSVEILLAIGDLSLDKHDYQLAGDAFQQAAKLDPENADAWLGVAKAFAPSDSEKATSAVESALKANPRHLESLLLLADVHLDGERYKEVEEALGLVTAVNPHHPRALAYRAILAHLRNQPDDERRYRDAALKHWPENPAVDHLIGKKLSQKYRFSEGQAYQRKVLELNPTFLPAKVQLAQDLLRLGREEEGLKLAQEVYEADGYNVAAHNLVTLQEQLHKFRSLEEDGFLVRMESREADLYGRRVLELLKRARGELTKKYDVELPSPIIVEIFPRQQDFAIRTFGMPGGAGFLGVCFGTVITANSPASQGNRPSCWESTLWHEFCHVVTLNKTHNKMPRWLSEGISVYEERQADPTWGQELTPQYRAMMLGDELTPVSRLSGAFLNPPTPRHLQFAYYESSLVVEFLIEKHGKEVLLRILTDLGVGMPIHEALARSAGSLEALDEQFAKYARERATKFAADADWAAPELPRQAPLELVRDWLKEHPTNYVALRKLAEQLMQREQWDEVIEVLTKMQSLYPGDTSADRPTVLLARVFRKLKDNSRERAVLEGSLKWATGDVEVLERLAELASEAGDWKLTRECALRWLAVNPLVPAPHRYAATAAEKLDDGPLALASYQALLLLDPLDPAETHYRMARRLLQDGQREEARRHVLWALEETPRFRDAQRLLLEIRAATKP